VEGPDSPSHLRNFTRWPPVGPDSLYEVQTGDTLQPYKWYYPPGHYEYVDSIGLKNGWPTYDVTAYSQDGRPGVLHGSLGPPRGGGSVTPSSQWTRR
jgi:hypothetical protein